MDKKKRVPRQALRFSHQLKFSETGDERKPEFNGVAYSGEMIENHWFWDRVIFDNSQVSAKDTVPILRDHDSQKIVGSGTIFVDQDKVLRTTGRISTKTEHGKEVKSLSDEGFPWQMSVHIQPKQILEVGQGQTYNVNGKDHNGPFTVFKDNVIKEVSFVALGADHNTSAQVFKDDDENEIEINIESKGVESMEFKFKEETKQVFMGETLIGTVEEKDGKLEFCGCQQKGNVVVAESEIEEKDAKISELESQIAQLNKEKEEKDAKASLEKAGLELDETKFSLFMSMSKEQRELFIDSSKKPEPSKELFSSDEDLSKAKPTNESMTVAQYKMRAKEIKAEYKAKGIELTDEEVYSKI